MSSEKLEDAWPVDGGDPEMREAIHTARASLGSFFAAFEDPQPNQTRFLLKARFVNKNLTEHIWLADLDLETVPGTGIVANETNFPGLLYMQRTSFNPDQITDWMYFEDDKLIGGYTTQLLRRRVQPH